MRSSAFRVASSSGTGECSSRSSPASRITVMRQPMSPIHIGSGRVATHRSGANDWSASGMAERQYRRIARAQQALGPDRRAAKTGRSRRPAGRRSLRERRHRGEVGLAPTTPRRWNRRGGPGRSTRMRVRQRGRRARGRPLRIRCLWGRRRRRRQRQLERDHGLRRLGRNRRSPTRRPSTATSTTPPRPTRRTTRRPTHSRCRIR